MSLFAGIVSIDLAFEEVGHEIVWANENSSFAVQTYKKNFPNVEISDKNIRNIPATDVPNMVANILVADNSTVKCQTKKFAAL